MRVPTFGFQGRILEACVCAFVCVCVYVCVCMYLGLFKQWWNWTIRAQLFPTPRIGGPRGQPTKTTTAGKFFDQATVELQHVAEWKKCACSLTPPPPSPNNHLRLDNVDENAIRNINIPTGEPFVYDFDADLKPIGEPDEHGFRGRFVGGER